MAPGPGTELSGCNICPVGSQALILAWPHWEGAGPTLS